MCQSKKFNPATKDEIFTLMKTVTGCTPEIHNGERDGEPGVYVRVWRFYLNEQKKAALKKALSDWRRFPAVYGGDYTSVLIAESISKHHIKQCGCGSLYYYPYSSSLGDHGCPDCKKLYYSIGRWMCDVGKQTTVNTAHELGKAAEKAAKTNPLQQWKEKLTELKIPYVESCCFGYDGLDFQDQKNACIDFTGRLLTLQETGWLPERNGSEFVMELYHKHCS